MRQIFLATTAMSLCLALAACNDDKGGTDNSSTFNELNQKIDALDSAQQQNKATIDGQNQEIAALKQARADDTAAFETRLTAVVKAIDERPDISPELEKRLVALKEQIGKIPAFETAEEFADFKQELKELRTELDSAPKTAKIAELSDSLAALSDKFASATDFREVKDYIGGVKAKLDALLAAADPEVLKTLKDTLATLRTDITGKTTFTDTDIKGFKDRIAGLEKLIDTKADVPPDPIDMRSLRPTFQSFTAAPGNFQLRKSSRIVLDGVDPGLAKALEAPMGWVQKLRFATGLELKVVVGSTTAPGDIILRNRPDRILLDTAETVKNTWDKDVRATDKRTRAWIVDVVPLKQNVLNEGYTYSADNTSVTLTYNKNFGAIHALQTLYQLLASDQRSPGEHRWLPAGQGLDYPLSEHRGVMIDVGRKFVSVEDLIGLMDKMSLYKLNVLHLHLNDDAPDATGVWHGFFRLYDDSLSDEFKKLKPKDDKYYTKADIKRLEEAASQYGIEIIPEIDLPGHSFAILAVHPEFGIKDLGIESRSLDISNPAVTTYVKRLIPEFASWFTGGKFHVGADEVAGTSPDKLATFVNGLYTSLQAQVGPKMFGAWCDVLYGAPANIDLNPGITVYDWRGLKRKQLLGKKWVEVGGLYVVPYSKGGWRLELKDGEPYSSYVRKAGENIGIPIGSEIALWNDFALTKAYGFEVMNAGMRLGFPSHAGVLWNGFAFDQAGGILPYEKLPTFKTSISQEESSYWIKSKFPQLSGTQTLQVLLDTSSFRHWSSDDLTIAPAPANKRATEMQTDPLGWDPLDMAAAFKKAEELVKQQTLADKGVMHLDTSETKPAPGGPDLETKATPPVTPGLATDTKPVCVPGRKKTCPA